MIATADTAPDTLLHHRSPATSVKAGWQGCGFYIASQYSTTVEKSFGLRFDPN